MDFRLQKQRLNACRKKTSQIMGTEVLKTVFSLGLQSGFIITKASTMSNKQTGYLTDTCHLPIPCQCKSRCSAKSHSSSCLSSQYENQYFEGGDKGPLWFTRDDEFPRLLATPPSSSREPDASERFPKRKRRGGRSPTPSMWSPVLVGLGETVAKRSAAGLVVANDSGCTLRTVRTKEAVVWGGGFRTFEEGQAGHRSGSPFLDTAELLPGRSNS
ncbi:uncharacterized protein CEXT_208501 [Caerostris extrusa]|uniref:Uncharacterized protein n=1 Tax=Caerostris extrusa TaxID=172846 RepID=A0AAV4XP09_CAEEX|nr:uncharacterized protein CEXT_208501 [Caerostris extrusa]